MEVSHYLHSCMSFLNFKIVSRVFETGFFLQLLLPVNWPGKNPGKGNSLFLLILFLQLYSIGAIFSAGA